MFDWLRPQPKNYFPPVIKPDGSRTRVFVGVSGGVDSSVSAAILRDKGYDVTGVFMKTYYPPEIKCTWREERLDAVRVCEHLGIPFVECDLEQEYKNNVFDYMVESYRAGITPNPDVFCNKYVKFGGFLDWAIEQGADYVATGHYAQNQRISLSVADSKNSLYKKYTSFFSSLPSRNSSNFVRNASKEKYDLVMGVDSNKDQTYFLYQLQQQQLKHAIFPVGDIPKDQVRRLAKKYGLFTAKKKDSQGLCFVGPVDMGDFLKQYIDEQTGDVLDESGQVIGQHNGSFFLTIGQRSGFEIFPEHRNPQMPRMFIVAKDSDNNTVTVSPNKHAHDSNTVTLAQVSWTGDPLEIGETVHSRIRHRGKLLDTTLELVTDNQYVFRFTIPHTGVAAGQSLVLYRDGVCLGGGIVI